MNRFRLIIRRVYGKTDKFIINHFWETHPIFATRFHYRRIVGKFLNLKNPTAFTEKLQWLKLYRYGNDPLVKQCADKYAVREYIKERGCGEILNELIGVWDSVEDINWDSLPDKFAMKCNHGSGYNLICTDKSKLDIETVKRTLDQWLHEEYGKENVELIYRGIPRKIICEKYIEPTDGEAPMDIKVFCSYGEPKFLYTKVEDTETKTENLDYFDLSWEHLPVELAGLPISRIPPKKPDNLEKIFDYARKLSAGFPIVRVDFYNENDTILFGELTFLGTGGLMQFTPAEYDTYFGGMFPIDQELKALSK